MSRQTISAQRIPSTISSCTKPLTFFTTANARRWGYPIHGIGNGLLEIEYRKRETFAYACEAYSRLLELGRDSKHRQDLLSELAAAPLPNDERVDGAEYLDILAEAITARNGWKRILARCSPSGTRSRTISTPAS
jgi:hypothetical protein